MRRLSVPPFGERSAGRPRRSVQGKLTTLVLTSVGVAVMLVAAVGAGRDSRRDAALQTHRLQTTAQTIGSLAADAVAQGDRARASAALRAVSLMPEVRYARLERLGRRFVETGSGARLVQDARVGSGGDAGLLSNLTSRSIEVSAPVLCAGRPVGRVVLLGRSEGVLDRLLSSLMVSALAAAAALAAGLLAAIRLQRSITRPILALTGAMREVEREHDYGRTVDIASDDEVGELVGGFNRMLHEVRARDARLAEHLAGLERQVGDRTADLRVAKDAAEAANGAKSDFLATMSHEIRTPMNAIMVMAEMLAAGEMTPRQRRFADVIAKSGASLLAIINDILDLSKIEAGKLELERAEVDLCEIAEDVAGLFWERAHGQGLDLAAYVDPATPRLVVGDPTRLRQVVGNLVNNAIKFTRTGGVLIEVEPRGEGEVCISVRDTGVGIPQDKIGHVFGAFSQADQSTTRKFGGTGLGLSICKRLVEAMGGRFEVSSRVGRGSTFAFRLPVEVIEVASAVEAGEGAGRLVVLAVDGLSSRRSLGRALARRGYVVETVDDAWPAQAVLVIGEPDRLRRLGPAPAPALCLADYGDGALEDLRQAGCADAVLVQPLRRGDLDAVLDRIARGEPLEDLSDAVSAPLAAALPQFPGARVLVADDSAVNREVAVEALARLGVRPELVVDGRQALDAVLSSAFDLVLMDGSMPEMDGYDASREIRRRQAEAGVARTPIVALTAHVVGAGAQAWREAGMDAVLHKPFTLAGLAATLGDFLRAADPVVAPVVVKTEAEPSAKALIDRRVGAELAAMAQGGRADFVRRVHTLYRENAPATLARMVEAARDQDAEAVASAAHALKSMSFNLGAVAVAGLAGTIEARAREGDMPTAAALERAVDTLAETLKALEDRPVAPVPVLVPIHVAGAPVSEPQGNGPSAEEARLLADLERALDGDGLSLLYQPQFDRNGEDILGVEALVRWAHPALGQVSPGVFVPLAEKFGLVRRLTDWVSARVLADAAELAPLTIAFNVSADEFKAADFADRMIALFDGADVDRSRFEIEVTETAVLDNEEQVLANIGRLHAAGFRIALDDFGTGYTSLRNLRRIPFDKLKIDQEFVADCMSDVQCASLVHAVVSVGRALGMKVVAEGVETEAQRRFLKVAGVHALQGYLLSRPIPAAAVARLRRELAEPLRAAG